MQFRTTVHIPTPDFSISHHSKTMMFGSCFAQHMGNAMKESKFSINLNPFGVLYNPISIGRAIEILMENREYTEADIFEYKGLYSSLQHHGSFSDVNKEKCLEKINIGLAQAAKDLQSIDLLIVTFGTSYVYQQIASQQVVGNCHKLPASAFQRYRLDVDTIVSQWGNLLDKLRNINPNLKTIFTVSPVRHLRDGAHDNQLSKSTLLLATELLCAKYANVLYFPSYEIVLDELRDYRFFNEDMVHPNSVAIKYVWQRFADTYFDAHTKQIIIEWSKIQNSINHRPVNEQTEEHKHFLEQTLCYLHQFAAKYPYICIDKEKDELKSHIDQ